MKLLFLNRGGFPPHVLGGIGPYLACLTPALVQRGHEVHVLCCFADQAPADEIYEGVHIHRRPEVVRTVSGRPSPLSHRLKQIAAYRSGYRRLEPKLQSLYVHSRLVAATAILREFRQLGERFDVIESPEWMALGLMLSTRERRTPIVTHAHTPLEISARFDGVGWSPDLWLASRLERIATSRSQALTTPSEMLRLDLERRGWATGKRMRTIRHPVDLARWRGLGDVGESPPTVLTVGRLERRKAPELVIDAAARLLDRVPGIRIEMVGAPRGTRGGTTYAEWLGRRAQEAGVPCTILGEQPRDGLREALSRARVVAFPSNYDNMPMAALESMAAGRPVVASRSTGIVELLAPRLGHLTFPAGDDRALSECLLPLLRDPDAASHTGNEVQKIIESEGDPALIAFQRETFMQQVINACA